jgi:hypothetical protein
VKNLAEKLTEERELRQKVTKERMTYEQVEAAITEAIEFTAEVMPDRHEDAVQLDKQLHDGSKPLDYLFFQAVGLINSF